MNRGQARGTRGTGRARTRAPWLLAAALPLACADGTGTSHTSGAALAPLSGEAIYRDVTAERGLPGPPATWPDGSFFMPEILQGGVGLFDYDGDGDLDLFQARIPPPGSSEPGVTPRLWRQEEGGRFTEVSAAAGLTGADYGQGVAIGDVDNDGDPDLYLTNYGRDRFYRNEGDGTFTDRTEAAGFRGERWGSSASFFDYDRDGFLDLYVVNYVRHDGSKRCVGPNDQREYCGPRSYHGWPDRLYRNRGDGTFEDVTLAAGIVLPDKSIKARGLGVACADFTQDGWPDVFVANDAESNQLWVNQRDGTFVEEGIVRGVGLSRYGMTEASMGVTVGDVNADGAFDLFMTHMWEENNRLYMGIGGHMFQDRSTEAKLSATDLERTGFGCGFLDVDLDGDLDLAVVNGAVVRRPPIAGGPAGYWGHYAEPNQLYENDGRGSFTQVDAKAGHFAAHIEVSRALAIGDLDADGDLDLVVSNIDNSIRVYESTSADAGAPDRHWLRVRALCHGRDALGAELYLTVDGRERRGLVLAGYSYTSSNDPCAHFGLGRAARVERIRVRWPEGGEEVFGPFEANRTVTLVQGEGTGA